MDSSIKSSQFKLHPFIDRLQNNYHQTQNLICVGLDPDLKQLPSFYSANIDGIFSFLMDVVLSTLDLCICYKPNISFFEALGIDGLKMLKKLVKEIPNTHPVIIDAKRGDIGNTSAMQATYIFDILGADATTLHPYMGDDSLMPFFKYKNKFNFVLGLTSNPGAKTFEKLLLHNNDYLYEKIIKQCVDWNFQYNNIGIVAGATQSELNKIRSIDSELLFLIPGVGIQGGCYKDMMSLGCNNNNLAVINVSRYILYGSDNKITKELMQNRIKQIIL